MGRKTRYSGLIPNDNIYVIESADQLPSELDQWRIYHLLYDPGDGPGLYFSPDNLSLVKITSSGGILPVGLVSDSLLRWDTGSVAWLEFSAFILPTTDGTVTQIMVTNGLGVVTWEPQGGGGGPAGNDQEIQYNDSGAFGADPHFKWDDTQDSLQIDAVDAISGDGAIEIERIQAGARALNIRSVNGSQTFHEIWRSWDHNNEASWILTDDHELSERILFWEDDPDDIYIEFASGGFQFNAIRMGGHAGSELVFINFGVLGDPTFAIRNDATLYIEETGVANPEIALHGQFWVRNDAPNVAMFTDDTGVDFQISGVGIAPGTASNSTLRWSGSAWVESTNVQIISNGNLRIVDTTAILRLDGTSSSADEARTEFRMVSSSGLTVMAITDSGFNSNFLFNCTRTGLVWDELQFQTDLAIFFGDFTMEGGSIYIDEVAAASADKVAHGQFWVRDDAPNTPMFTSDVGFDSILARGDFDETITGDWTLSGAIEFTNVFGVTFGPSTELDLRNSADNSTTFIQNLGPTLQFGIAGGDFGSGIFEISQSSWAKVVCPPLFVGEQAVAEADVAGDGQFWVRNDVPNTPMFTNDVGDDFVLNLVSASTAADRMLRANATGGYDESPHIRATFSGILQIHGPALSNTFLLSNNNTDAVINTVGLTDLNILGFTNIRADMPLAILEAAAAPADLATYGQVWVRDDAPNTLMYTDDAGTDFIVGGSPTGVYTRDATVVEDRTLLASASATTTNNNNVLAALIADLQARGLLG